MSRTSETPEVSSTPAETNELRCTCGKCLAKDGMIKCTRCSKLTALPPAPDFRQVMAFQLAAKALSAKVLDHSERPVEISIIPGLTPAYAGYVRFEPSVDRPLLTVEDMKRKLIVLMSGCAAERIFGNKSARDLESVVGQCCDLAMRICDLECVEGDRNKRALMLVGDAMFEATRILLVHRAEHNRLASLLLEKGELTADDINGLDFALA